jgi:hypothetical protein
MGTHTFDKPDFTNNTKIIKFNGSMRAHQKIELA